MNALNNDQRIILASHRFAPEVTSAALWLNQKVANEDLLTCIKLTPYQDTQKDTLYVQASTIIPVPGVDDYLVRVAHGSERDLRESRSSLGAKLTATFARNKNDVVSQFLKKVGRLAIDGLPAEIRPDKIGRWAGDTGSRRYYHLWYSRAPWGNWNVNYSIDLRPHENSNEWFATVLFENRRKLSVPALEGIHLNAGQESNSQGDFTFVRTGPDTLNDSFANRNAETLREFIEEITPLIDDLENETSEEDDA